MDIKWIKICTDIFDDEKIMLIDGMPESDAIIVIWFKLLCLAGKQNNSGVFMLSDRIPFTDEMLATIFRRPLNTVRLALTTFEKFGMVEVINNTYTIPNWKKHQSLDEYEKRKEADRIRKAEKRKEQKMLSVSADSPRTVRGCPHLDKIREEEIREEIREDIDIEREKERKRDSAESLPRHKYGEYKNVLLSDEDIEKLKTEFPRDWQTRIERLSAYIAQSGKSYKNHLATIRNWARSDADNKQQHKAGSFDCDDFFNAAIQKSYSDTEE